MSGHRKKKRRKRASGDVALQITSMADIFMILLVFLLKSYATSVSNISPSAHISLPEVTQPKGAIKETLKVEIADNTVLVDQKPAVALNKFEFDPGEDGPGGVSPSVLKVLNDQRKLKPEANMDSSLIVMADQQTPYSTVKRVVASAASAGFVDLQLIVVQGE